MVPSYCHRPPAEDTPHPDCIPSWLMVATCLDALHLPPAVVVDCVHHLCRRTEYTPGTSVGTQVRANRRWYTSQSDDTWGLGKWVLRPHAVPKDDALAEHAGRTAGRRSILHCRRCHTAEQDSSSVDAPWTWGAARCPEYAAEVAVRVVGFAADFDSDSVIVAAVIAELAVQIAAAGGAAVASQPVDAVLRSDAEYMLHVVWHCVQFYRYGRYAAFRHDHHPEGS